MTRLIAFLTEILFIKKAPNKCNAKLACMTDSDHASGEPACVFSEGMIINREVVDPLTISYAWYGDPSNKDCGKDVTSFIHERLRDEGCAIVNNDAGDPCPRISKVLKIYFQDPVNGQDGDSKGPGSCSWGASHSRIPSPAGHPQPQGGVSDIALIF